MDVVLKPDQAWLTNPDTVYPVTIDPYYDWSTTVTSTTVVKGQATGWPDADSLFVGTYDSTWSARSFVTWWATGLQGMQVDSALLHFANPYSTTCSQTPWEIWTTSPITSTTSWDDQPEWQYKDATSTSTSCNNGWVTADASGFFQRAVEKEVGTPTMGLRAADETATNQYKQFWSHNYTDSSKLPYVEVNYSQLPAAPTDPDQAVWDKQNELSNLKDWIITQPGIENSGYIESVNDAATKSTKLLWYGPANAAQASILAEAQRRGITATVEQRQYSSQQIDAALAQVSESSGQGVFDNFVIDAAAGISANFDGIVVAGRHTDGQTDSQLAQAATQDLGIAVNVKPGTPARAHRRHHPRRRHFALQRRRLHDWNRRACLLDRFRYPHRQHHPHDDRSALR
ncbi:hypothetical protein [Actinoplanes sp. NPDC049265]|uniref:hypothetical protein n=1 Tax=Actinoplanes sp. NPDC049265 TaxID=3363902 RepID=UPI003721DBB5